MNAANLFDDIPARLPEELAATILQAGSLRIQRIVSQGQASRPGFWYDQDDNEWVVVLEGAAAVEFEGHAEPRPAPARLALEYPGPRKTSGRLDRPGPENGLAGGSLPRMILYRERSLNDLPRFQEDGL